MAVFIADAHAIIWRLIAPAKLAANADAAFDLADLGQAELHVPSVVLAEMIMVAEKGRVPGWGIHEVRRFAEAAQRSANYHLSSLTPEVVLASASLASIPDVFDRLVAAEAVATDAALISRDLVFSSVNGLRVVWAD